MALIAWLRAPAPITWTSTLPICRTTPASAPATELGFDREDTFRTSMAVPSLWGTECCVSCARYAAFLPKTPRRRTVCPIPCQAYLRSVLRQPRCVDLDVRLTQGSHRALPHGNPWGKGPATPVTGPLCTQGPHGQTCRSGLDVGHLRLDRVHGVPDAGLAHHLVGDLDHQLGAGGEELLGLLPTLAELLALVGEPGPGLLDDAEVDAEVDDRALPADPLAVHDVELGLLERRGALVLHDLDPRAVAHHLGAVFQALDPTDVEADRGVELEGPAPRRGLGRAEHHADLLPQLVDEDGDRLRPVEVAGELAQRLAHQPGLEADVGVAHLPLDLGPGHQGGHRVDHDHVERPRPDEHVGDL